jgi:hypothetical protein
VYKVLFFERTIGVTPAARAFAHDEYFTAFLTFGAVVGFAVAVGVVVGSVEAVGERVGVGATVGVGDARVIGVIPAVIA